VAVRIRQTQSQCSHAWDHEAQHLLVRNLAERDPRDRLGRLAEDAERASSTVAGGVPCGRWADIFDPTAAIVAPLAVRRRASAANPSRRLPVGLHAGDRPPAARAGLVKAEGRAWFHAAWRPTTNGGRVTSPLATQVMYELYPANVRKWIARHGGLSERLILLKGRELAAVVPACDAGPATRTNPTMRTRS
jgi:hypothetical protein